MLNTVSVILCEIKMAVALSKDKLLGSLKPFIQNIRQSSERLPRVEIGLCVSGGPDSMALASLMSSLTKDDLGFNIKPIGLIVDHNARPESADEAKLVSERLSKLGIRSHISKIPWTHRNPLRMPNFESEARDRRYHELTLTAKELDIRHLFLGHHRDDQIETLMLRLIRNKEPSFLSLRGMDADGPISASHAIYGARHGMTPVAMKDLLQSLESDAQPGQILKSFVMQPNPPLTVNARVGQIMALPPNGIEIHRPLLEFSKAELLATCDAHSIPYLKDKTNDDPQFTTRNAIRFLRTHPLPRALQDHSLGRLAEISRSHFVKLEARIADHLQKIFIFVLDLRVGTAIIRLPKDFVKLAVDDKPAAAGVLTQLCHLVTPIRANKTQTLADKGQLDLLAKHVNSRFWGSESNENAPSFCCAKVQFEGIRPGSYTQGDFTFWRLSRQALRPEELVRTKLTLAAAMTPEEDHQHMRKRERSSEWVFYDNRFWIQVTTSEKRTVQHLVIRPFHARDWESLGNNFAKQASKNYRGIMSNIAPGKLRYTLPVIEFKGCPIAFPTLSDDVHATKDLKTWSKGLGRQDIPSIKWQVNYKVLPESVIKWAQGSRTVLKDRSPTSTSTYKPAEIDPPSLSSYHSQNQTPPSPSTRVSSPTPAE